MADQISQCERAELSTADSACQEGVKVIPTGGTLQVLATDPGAVKDFEAFCRTTGNELVESKAEGNVFSFVIKRA
jgi:tRNA 2-thiouridine synthesizing protein A